MSDNRSTVYDRIIEWGIPIVGVAVMISLSTISLNPLYVKSTVMQCGVALLFAIWAIGAFRGNGIVIPGPLSRVLLPAAAFMFSALMSFLFVTSSRDTSLDELMVRIPYFMVFLVAALVVADIAKIRIVLAVITAAAFGVSLYGMLQHFSLDPLGLGDPVRIQSTFGNPNFYVGFLTLAIPVVAARFDFSDPGERKKTAIVTAFIIGSAGLYYALTAINGERGIHFVAFGGALVALAALCFWQKLGAKSFPAITLFLLVNNLFLTRSRSGQIGLGTALVAFAVLAFLFMLPKRSLKKTIGIAIGSLALAGLVTAGVLHLSYSDEGRLKTVSERKYYVDGALNLIAQKPVFGHGIGTFKNNYPLIKKAESWAYNAVCFEHVSNVYNEHLEIFHDEGIVGLGVWVWLIVAFLLSCFRAMRAIGRDGGASPPVRFAPSSLVLLIGLVSGIVALLVSNIFSLSMRYVSTGYFFWLFLGFAAGLSSRVLSAGATDASELRVTAPSPARQPGTLVRVLDVTVVLLATAAVVFSVSLYLADVYLNRAVACSKDAYTPLDTEGQVFHDIFIEGTRYRSDSLAWEQAFAWYRRSLASNPYNLRTRYFLGNAFNRRWNLRPQYNPVWGDRDSVPRTDFNRAMEQYHYIIAQAPHFTEIDFELGDLYLKLGAIDRAIASYRDYKRYKPFFTKIHYTLANAYVAQKEWTNAAEAYKDALDLNQKFTIGYLELSAVYHKLGRSDLSAEMFERAAEVSPEKVHMAMADVWQRFGEKERSLESLRLRIAQDSTDARPYARLGWIAIENKQWEQAIAWYEKAVRFNPKHAPAWVNLSNIYFNLGRMDEAKAAYERANAADARYVRSIVQGTAGR